MALASTNFSIGDSALVAQQYELSLNFHDGEGYQVVCNTGLDEQLNESVDTKYLLCGEGNASNTITTSDYTIPLEGVMVKGKIAQTLYNARFDKKFRTGVSARLKNTLMDKTTEWDAVIMVTNFGGVSETTAMFSGEIKVASGTPIVIDGTSANAVGEIKGTFGVSTNEIGVLYAIDGDGTLSLVETANPSVVVESVPVTATENGETTFLGLVASTSHTIYLRDSDGTIIDEAVVSTTA